MLKDDLRDTILRLRNEDFADLPVELVEAILAVEQELPVNRIEARRRIDALIKNQLRSEGFEC